MDLHEAHVELMLYCCWGGEQKSVTGPLKEQSSSEHKLVTRAQPITRFVMVPPSASCILTRGGGKKKHKPR